MKRLQVWKLYAAVQRPYVEYAARAASGCVYRLVEWVIGLSLALLLLGAAHWLWTH